MRHGVDKALRVYLMLEHCTAIPSLVDGSLVVVAKLFVAGHFHLPVNELPPRQATHRGHESQCGVVVVDQLSLVVILELPPAVALVRHLGVEEEQLHQLFIAVVGIGAQSSATTIR